MTRPFKPNKDYDYNILMPTTARFTTITKFWHNINIVI